MLNIGVIDSGVGGLTVLFDVYKAFSGYNYYYLGDSKNCPYGTKSCKEIKNLSFKMVEFLVSKKNIDILIIACNSISSTSYEFLKKKFSKLIIIETVMPTAKYIKDKKYKKVGLIATSATVNSKMYEKNLKNCEVVSKACPSFVTLAENINIDKEKKEETVNSELSFLIDKNIDALILGCTHFPLLKKEISKFYKGPLISSSVPIIKELTNYLKPIKSRGSLDIYTTGDSNNFKMQLMHLFNEELNVEKINLD